MPSVVIFDLDGVIADTHPLHTRAWRQLLREQGREVGDEELNVIREGRRREEIMRHFFSDLSLGEAAELGTRKDQLFRLGCGEVAPMPGLVRFLDELEEFGVQKIVATSASKRRAVDLLSQLRLIQRFVAVVTGDDIERGKPDPSIFLLAAKHCTVRVCDALVIEDSVAGVQGAKAAGMKCVGLGTDVSARRLYEAGADCVIPSFSEISWSDLRNLTPCKVLEQGSCCGA